MSIFRWLKRQSEPSGSRDDNSLEKIVARRAKELGGHIDARDVTVIFKDSEVAPGCRVFQAWWGAGEARGSLSGLIRMRGTAAK